MTDKRFTNSQSPRASRDSTQDPLEHARGLVRFETGSTGRVSPENEGVEQLFTSAGRVKQDDSVRDV